jgi:hypothetical protein
VFGMGSFLVNAAPPLPASRGPFSKGLSAFIIQPAQCPPLPAGNIFAKLRNSAACAKCPHPCGRRGMGDDSSTIYGPSIAQIIGTDPATQAAEQAAYDAAIAAGADQGSLTTQTAPIGTFDLGSPDISLTPSSTSSSNSSNIYTLPASMGGGTINISEAQAAMANPSLTPAQTLAAAGLTAAQIASLTTAQQQSLVSQIGAAGSPGILSSLTTWLSQSTILSGYTNATVALGGGAIGVLLLALASKKKGRR